MKKIVASILTIIIILSSFVTTASAADLTNLKIDAPEDFFYAVEENENKDIIRLYYVIPENLAILLNSAENNAEYLKQEYDYDNINIYIQNDWKTNEWHEEEDWNIYPTQGMGFELENKIYDSTQIFNTAYAFHCDLLGISDRIDSTTFEFKCRYFIELIKNNEEGNPEVADTIISEWSESVVVGKDIKVERPTKFNAIEFKNVEIKYDAKNNNRPYISFNIVPTQLLKDMILTAIVADSRELTLLVERKVGDGEWEKAIDDLVNNSNPYSYGERRIYIPTKYIESDSPVQYRLIYTYSASNSSYIKSFITEDSEYLTYEYKEITEETTTNNTNVEPTTPDKENNLLVPIILIISLGGIGAVVILVVVKRKKGEKKEEKK